MTKQEFQKRLRELESESRNGTGNVGCIGCEDSERCIESQFCNDSDALTHCRYCNGSARLFECSHCNQTTDSIGCTHTNFSKGCVKSAYLEHSTDCRNCNYCFGCVGLVGKDFHILNEAYDRETYFKLTRELSRTVG